MTPLKVRFFDGSTKSTVVGWWYIEFKDES